MKVTWRARAVPLAPQAVTGAGEVGRALARRALERVDPSALRGVIAEDRIVLIGPDTPWADGATWLGVAAPGLWLPTLAEPDVHPELLARALRKRGLTGPVVLLPDAAIPVGAARPIDSDLLRAWL